MWQHRRARKRREQEEHVSGRIVLGIETSCDETGVGLVRDGELLGDALASSMDEHARVGAGPLRAGGDAQGRRPAA
jgi:hypothetical protein